MKNKKVLQSITVSAIFAALAFVMTYFVKIPVPVTSGYVHLGDSMIYLFACLLPMPYAMASAAVAGMLSDGLGGYAVYIIPTMIVKALLVTCFTSKNKKIICKKNVIGCFICVAITTVGYYIADVVILTLSNESFSTALTASLANVLGNVIQAVASGVIFIILGKALDTAKIKSRI